MLESNMFFVPLIVLLDIYQMKSRCKSSQEIVKDLFVSHKHHGPANHQIFCPMPREEHMK